jgi:hypothetical protein
MKQIFIILCLFMAFLTSANAMEMYHCVDRNGNPILTSSPQDGMENCVLTDSDEDSSPRNNITSQKEAGKERKRGADSQCNLVSSNMNSARTNMNQAAMRKPSELEEGKQDVKKALDFLLEAQRMSSYCQCPSLGEEIYKAAQLASFAVNETSVSRFSDLLTKAIQAFNNSQEAFKLCK